MEFTAEEKEELINKGFIEKDGIRYERCPMPGCSNIYEPMPNDSVENQTHLCAEHKSIKDKMDKE